MNLKILTGFLIFYLVVILGTSAESVTWNSTEEGGWNVTFNQTDLDENESVILAWNLTKQPYPDAVTHLRMGNDNATHIEDENSTNNNDAKIEGATDTAGVIGRGKKFDGTNDYLNISYSASMDILDNDEPFAFATWFRFDALSGAVVGIFAQTNGDGTGRIWVFTGADDNIKVSIGGFKDTGVLAVVGTWYLVAVNYNGTDMQIYVNDVLKVDVVDAVIDENANGSYLLGSDKSGASGHFNGTIDEVMLYDRNLSRSEISDLYNNSWYESGNITTNGIRDAGAGKAITNISCSATSQPAGTDVNLYANTSSDNSAFSTELVKASATCDGTNYTISSANRKRYYKVIAELNTTASATPHISKLRGEAEVVDTTVPAITIHQPKNKTYLYIVDIPLRVSSGNTIDTWWYSIDGGSNTTFTPNTTLFNQNNGNHYITVWTNLSNGNENSSTIYFSVDYMGELNVTEFAETVWNYSTRNITGGNTDNYFDKILGGDIMAMPLLLLITMMVSMVAIAEWKNDRWLYLFTTIWPLMIFFYSITNNPFASYTTYKLDMLWLFSTLILTVYMLIRAGMGPWNTVRVRIQKFRF